MKRYTIVGRMHQADHDSELAQCDSNPEALVKAYTEMMLTVRHSIFLTKGGGKKTKVRKYSWVRIIDNGKGQTPS